MLHLSYIIYSCTTWDKSNTVRHVSNSLLGCWGYHVTLSLSRDWTSFRSIAKLFFPAFKTIRQVLEHLQGTCILEDLAAYGTHIDKGSVQSGHSRNDLNFCNMYGILPCIYHQPLWIFGCIGWVCLRTEQYSTNLQSSSDSLPLKTTLGNTHTYSLVSFQMQYISVAYSTDICFYGVY